MRPLPADTAAVTAPAFLPLRPRAVTRPWGGRALARRFGWADRGPVGEWWLASCHAAALSELSDAARAEGARDLPGWLDGPGRGRGLPDAAGFPLLVKFLDAQELLSVQVHPDDAVARAHGLPNGKTEAWVVLGAEPGATLWLGTAEGVSVAQLHAALAAGADDDAVRALLRPLQPEPGDVLLVPAGTVHAIGPGLQLYEIQQTSDATYRLHDWGRGRELHLGLAADALRDHPLPQPCRAEPRGPGLIDLIDDAAFRLRCARVDGELSLTVERGHAVLTLLEGRGELRDACGTTSLAAGDSVLLVDACTLHGQGLQLLLAEPAF